MTAEQQYDDAILNSSALDANDKAGNPIPVTIPIALAPGVKVVYTTRLGGVSTGDWATCNLGGKGGDDPVHVASNRAAVAREVGAPLSLVSQVHSGRAVDIDELGEADPDHTGFVAVKDGGAAAADANTTTGGAVSVVQADGQVTSRQGVVLGMFAADCLPVLLADPQTGVIGACHCGRKGLERGIIASTVDLMVGKGAKPERIVATLGPRICGDCYEVGDEIADAFDAKFPGTFTLSRFGGPGIDIAKAAVMGLKAAGIPQDNIISSLPRVAAATQYLAQDEELSQLCASDGEGDSDLKQRITAIREGMCTLENPLWYSHRRAALAHKPHEGRMLALIVRE